MLIVGIVVWCLWFEKGGCRLVVLVGYSLGEYLVLVVVGVFYFKDVVLLVWLCVVVM